MRRVTEMRRVTDPSLRINSALNIQVRLFYVLDKPPTFAVYPSDIPSKRPNTCHDSASDGRANHTQPSATK